jgi:pilus assembly protein CpaD
MFWNKGNAPMRNRIISARFSLLVGSALLLGLGACSTAPKNPWGLPGSKHKIAVTQLPEMLNVALSERMDGLTELQKRTLRGYAAAYLDHGYGPLAISRPLGTPISASARRAAQQTQSILHQAGVDWSVIVVGKYQATGLSKAPLVLSFTRYVAKAEGCSEQWRNLATHPGNNESDNFGCSLAANTAAMIANPYDLVRPATVDPASTQRRQTIMEKYIAGQPTGTERTADEKGSISDAAN